MADRACGGVSVAAHLWLVGHDLRWRSTIKRLASSWSEKSAHSPTTQRTCALLRSASRSPAQANRLGTLQQPVRPPEPTAVPIQCAYGQAQQLNPPGPETSHRLEKRTWCRSALRARCPLERQLGIRHYQRVRIPFAQPLQGPSSTRRRFAPGPKALLSGKCNQVRVGVGTRTSRLRSQARAGQSPAEYQRSNGALQIIKPLFYDRTLHRFRNM